ncbi:MAG: rhomboid family intramembrane serine protease [Thermodesulfobacteriota bacterium]
MPHEIQTQYAPKGIENWTAVISPHTPESDFETLRLYCLVLASRGVPYTTDSANGALYVPEPWFPTAQEEINAFAQEEHHWHNPDPGYQPLHYGRIEPTLWVFFGLLLLHIVTQSEMYTGLGRIEWQQWGSAKEWLILQGQWWRTGTALTLHNDAAHLVGNIGLGGLFVGLLCKEIGSGWGWFLVLSSGMLGNAGNAWLSPSGHTAVGASTAIFGAVGAIGGLRALQGQTGRVVFDSLLPLGACLGIVALLGTGGGNTDVGAHFWGFGCGILLGALFGIALRWGWVPTPLSNRLAAVTAIGLLGSAWLCAIGSATS